MTQLHWAESQAIHVWRAAGYNLSQISEGMRLNINAVRREVYVGVKTKRALEAMPIWCDVDIPQAGTSQGVSYYRPRQTQCASGLRLDMTQAKWRES